ncbi:MAG TPA: DUF721 domain-containing protein [Acidiphilium sp.]|nr:MAG: hypothetical protein B7Z67_11105 [Acidiphilium sp. 21-60-14]OYV90185.1 MAG: hypothetical protein B7Z57_09730 [Acidiphilium sp. 37-60-79]OZB41212.1 MAG: hypothetical protein B7X48_00705 [Acidiphilium sp. 34-60-192]HQT89376.1 DUF721 domain-containing protein [Acidiphilium sp.]HQU25037.1 DUF721 domain-containing protein [Acidiphilium sp.]
MAVRRSRQKDVAGNSAPVEPARHYGARGIGALLAPVVRPALRARGPALASVLEDWEALVGPEIAARSQPVKLAAGSLTLACAGPDALELQHRAPSLIGRINQALGGAPVTRLKFVAVAAGPAPAAPALHRRASEAPPLADGSLDAALARLQWHLGTGEKRR